MHYVDKTRYRGFREQDSLFDISERLFDLTDRGKVVVHFQESHLNFIKLQQVKRSGFVYIDYTTVYNSGAFNLPFDIPFDFPGYSLRITEDKFLVAGILYNPKYGLLVYETNLFQSKGNVGRKKFNVLDLPEDERNIASNIFRQEVNSLLTQLNASKNQD